MSTTNPSSSYFEAVAGQWDAMRTSYFTEGVRDAAIAKAYLRPEMVVGDVGAGTGFVSAGLIPLVKRVYVMDGSPAMLDVARRNLAAFNNVEFHLADGLSLPLPDDSLDAVFANMYLHHCPDPLAAIREMVRILRPGGRLIITDADAHPYAWLKEELADLWQGFERDQMRAWYRQAGLVNRIVDGTGQSCCASSGSPMVSAKTGEVANISIFVAVGTKPVAGVEDEVRKEYAAHAEGTSSSCSPDSSQACACSGDGGGQCCSGSTAQEKAVPNMEGYSQDVQGEVPPEAVEIALGCGNPTAIAALQPGEWVLDIGSGGGLDAFLSARRVGLSGHVIGVDMTPAMLERARRTAAQNGYTQVEFRQGQAEALPVEDASIDVVISNCVINLTQDKGQVFAEAFRALKAGGRLEVSDMVTNTSVPADLRENPANWSDCVYGALPEGEYVDLIRQAGFGAVIVRRSLSAGEMDGTRLYSVTVSARKGADPNAAVQILEGGKPVSTGGCCS